MKLLVLGCKEYPYGISEKFESFPGGGTAKYVITLVNNLEKKNIDIILITRKFSGQKTFEKKKRLQIHRVSFINNKYLRLPSFAFNSLIKALKLNKFDIIHAHGVFNIGMGYFLSKLLKKPIIGTPHGSVFNQHKGIIRFLFYVLEKTMYRKVNKLIFLSNQEQKRFEELFQCKFGNAVVIQTGIPAYTTPLQNKSTKQKSKKFNILFIGRLVPVKRVDRLIKSLTFLDSQLKKSVHLDIVGEGYERINLENLSKSLKLNEVVEFKGFHSDIDRFLKSADVFVLPSDSEGLPIALLEAMARGLPSIVNNVGIPVSKESVLFLKNNSEKMIAKALTQVAENREFRVRLSINAQKEIREHFSVDHMLKKHIDLYAQLTQK